MDEQQIAVAASTGRRARVWRASSAGPNSINLAGASLIRARARDQVRNNPWGAAALDRLTSNGIATGIQAKGEWGSKAFRKADTALYAQFMEECDADWTCNGFGQQALAWREWKEVGEVFVRHRYRRETDGLAVPYQVQLIPSEQCPNELYTTATNGNPVRAGIEFDLIGRRVAYWMHREHPGDQAMHVNGHDLVRVPADQVSHVFQPKRAGQIRGTPDITPALMRMFTLDRFADNVLERQAIANLFMGFVTKKAGAEEGDGGGLVQPNSPSAAPEEGVQLAGMEPATLQELPEGYDIKFASPPDAGAAYPEYMRQGLLGIAAAFGIPIEVLTGDLRNISDRALRLILNEFRRLIEMWQWVTFIPSYCQPIRQRYLDTSVLVGKLDVPNYASVRADVAKTLWVPQGWPYSHPVQDVDADIKAIRAGLASRTATVLARGEDPEQVEREIRRDNERADQLQLVLTSDARQTSDNGQAHAAAPAPGASEETEEQ